MPRRSKGARLWLRPPRRDKAGKVVAHAVWLILDQGKHIATGCIEGETGRAEQVLAAYIAQKYHPDRRERDLESIPLADVLSIYVDDCAHQQTNQKQFRARISRLNDFWGEMSLASVTGESCRRYAKHRSHPGGARRDLEDLRAAINHHAKEGLHRGVVRVVLPDKGAPRDRWLRRAEVGRLLRTCWRYREQQLRHRGQQKGKKLPTKKYPLRHLARFILIGVYTGTRAAAIASASPVPKEGRSFVDLDQGIFYRLAQGKKQTKKRQTPVPVPPRLLAHLRRWQSKGIAKTHFVEWNGRPVRSVKTAFKRAVTLARIDGRITPHTLRHTAATWLMQAGVPIWEAAGFLGMSVEVLERVYGHHHPAHLRSAAEGIGVRRGGRQSLVIPLVGALPGTAKGAKNR